MGRLLMPIKNRLDLIISMIIWFILLSPQTCWDESFGGFKFDQLFFIAISVLLIVVLAADPAAVKRNIFTRTRENLWLMLYVVVMLAAVAFSTNQQLSLMLLPRCLSGLFLVIIIALGDFTYEKTMKIFGYIAFGVALTALYAVFQAIIGVPPDKSYTDLAANPNMPGRVYSFFDNPNVYGFALVLLLPMAAAYALSGKSWFRVAIGSCAFALGVIALVLTYSRGAWLGLAIGTFVFVLLCKPKLVPIFLLIAAAAIPFLPSNIKNRLFSVFNYGDSSISSRSLLFDAGLKVVKTRPVLGAGLGLDTVKEFVLQNFWPTYLRYRFPHAHNLPLQIMCETGILGAVTFFGMIIQYIIRAGKSFAEKDMGIKLIIAAHMSAVVGIIICGITDYPLSFSRIYILFWIVLGFLGLSNKKIYNK